jgi:16S rRNA (uracil1498-N3)-methyltransferase
MELYYVRPENVSAETVLLTGEESRHLVRVMRARVGDCVFASDGLDRQFEVQLAVIGKESAECRIINRLIRQNEPEREVTLAVSWLRNPARFEFLIEKAVELGVRRIIPLVCERTVAKREKRDRLQKIALAAMKQSVRSWLPPVEEVTAFAKFVAEADRSALRLLPHEKASTELTIPRLLSDTLKGKGIVIAIGPEGGFSDAEVEQATAAEFALVSLGCRRLRTETAAVTALAQLFL